MMDIKIIAGRSNDTGFELKIEINGYEKSVKTQSYDLNYSMNNKSNIFSAIFISITGFLFLEVSLLKFLSLTTSQFLFGCVLSFLSCLLLCALIWTIVKNKESKEWHACQHKTMNLLSSGEIPSMDNFKKQSKKHAYCEVGMAAMSCLIFVFYLGVVFIDKWAMPFLGKSYFWLMFVILYFPYAILVSKCLSDPMQNLIIVEPSEEKLKESLDLALRVVRIKQLTT